jgi:endonuclease YncB( thermonuclease family)
MQIEKVNFPFERRTRSSQPRKLIRDSDGDTIVIEQPIRMVSCDTPEKAGFAGPPPTAQQKLNECAHRLRSGFFDDHLPTELREYLLARLTGDAAERHINAGVKAGEEFNKILERRLTRQDGAKRKVAVIPTGEIIDNYGRLLAYTAPYFSKNELPPKGSPERQTFNVDMIANGWAAFFPIYPSLPQNDDMNMAIASAELAWEERRGAWKNFGENLLLGYEFRACIKLAAGLDGALSATEAFQRICVDLRTLREVGKHGFFSVPPCYRLWIWEEDIQQARIDLGLN